MQIGGRTAKWLMAMCAAAMGVGCQTPPGPSETVDEDGHEVEEQAVVKPPAPKEAPPGSLGGICGKNYVDCDKDGKAFKKFNKIGFSNVKTKVAKEGDVVTANLTVEVPKLVNDHKGSKDVLQLRHRETLGAELSAEFWRNGVRVGKYLANVSTDYQAQGSLDLVRGGAETFLALTMSDRAFTRIQRDIQAKPWGLSCEFHESGLVGPCGVCRWQKAFVIGGIGFIGAAAGPLVGAGLLAGGLIAAGGAAITDLPEYILGCDDICEKADCNDRYCDCTGNKDVCDDDIQFCCRAAGSRAIRLVDGTLWCAVWPLK